MEHRLYPWGGKFDKGSAESSVAVVTLSDEISLPKDKVALFGAMKTENLGVEKVIANIVSNPIIRFVIVCGKEVRGHRSGDSIVNIYKNGVDENNRVVGAKSAIPYIENLPVDAVDRFRRQVELVDLVDVTDESRILMEIDKCLKQGKKPFGEPLYVEPLAKGTRKESVHTEIGLHAGIDLDLYGYVRSPECV
ncbi:MAG: tetrahydromethanopterin S-methyltransferase subunit A [Candidatus Altiarchaeota archaeon]